jgi:hypothetical protein
MSFRRLTGRKLARAAIDCSRCFADVRCVIKNAASFNPSKDSAAFPILLGGAWQRSNIRERGFRRGTGSRRRAMLIERLHIFPSLRRCCRQGSLSPSATLQICRLGRFAGQGAKDSVFHSAAAGWRQVSGLAETGRSGGSGSACNVYFQT